MGSARSSQVARERAAEVERQQASERKQRELRRMQELYEAQLTALKSQYESERDALLRELAEEEQKQQSLSAQRLEIARLRRADHAGVSVEENGARKARKGTIR
jgi:hypothetical protein